MKLQETARRQPWRRAVRGQMRNTRRRTYLIGALGGTFATVFHTLVMLIGHAILPQARRHPTPPRQITAAVAGKTVSQSAPDARVTLGTALLHVGYGASAGVLYVIFAATRERPLARGVIYGVGVWAASYLGWLPALRIPPPATRQPAQQNATMLLAHVAWGAALAAAVAWLDRRRALG